MPDVDVRGSVDRRGLSRDAATRHVLLADDDPDLRLLAELLFRQADWDVTLAADGRELLDRWTPELAAEVAVVVLDVTMPEVDGMTAAAELRRRGWAGPIVLWTGWAVTMQEQDVASIGATVVTKASVDDMVGAASALVA